jgi:hypothetical protein
VPLQSAVAVQSCRAPDGQVIRHVVLMAPAAVNSSQQIPIEQLLLPEHASESPLHVAAVVHDRPLFVVQQTCVFESHGPIAPHAI